MSSPRSLLPIRVGLRPALRGPRTPLALDLVEATAMSRVGMTGEVKGPHNPLPPSPEKKIHSIL